MRYHGLDPRRSPSVPMRPFTLLPAALLASGCVPATQAPIVATAVPETALAEAARLVQRCYRSPRIASNGRQIVTRLRVRLADDGQVAGLPVVVLQDGVTPANQPFAGRMAEAAIAAVIRCAPLRLPASYYQNGFTEFDLTFSPLARG
jgi:hypothetical protein